MFAKLTFAERRELTRKLLSGVAYAIYEADELRRDPRAVTYPGQTRHAYIDLTDELQGVIDDVQAVDAALASA